MKQFTKLTIYEVLKYVNRVSIGVEYVYELKVILDVIEDGESYLYYEFIFKGKNWVELDAFKNAVENMLTAKAHWSEMKTRANPVELPNENVIDFSRLPDELRRIFERLFNEIYNSQSTLFKDLKELPHGN